MILVVDPVTGLLPEGVHRASLSEVYDTFVGAAPYREERELLFRVMSAYLDIVQSRFADPRVLLNGGFVTHKPWAAPKDADLSIGLSDDDFISTFSQQNISLWTISRISIETPDALQIPKMQPMGGLVDGYFFPRSQDEAVQVWERQWSRVKGEDGLELAGVRKGFVEVAL